MSVTDVKTTFYDKKGNVVKTIVEKYEPKEFALKVQTIKTGKSEDMNYQRVHIQI